MGTPMFAVPILKSLYQNGYPISVVYTQPPQKSQRGQKINKSPVQGISETLNIDFRCPKTLRDNDEEYNFIKELTGRFKFEAIYFDDDTFNIGNKHTEKMSDVMSKFDIPWFAMCRADTSKKETWKKKSNRRKHKQKFRCCSNRRFN